MKKTRARRTLRLATDPSRVGAGRSQRFDRIRRRSAHGDLCDSYVAAHARPECWSPPGRRGPSLRLNGTPSCMTSGHRHGLCLPSSACFRSRSPSRLRRGAVATRHVHGRDSNPRPATHPFTWSRQSAVRGSLRFAALPLSYRAASLAGDTMIALRIRPASCRQTQGILRHRSIKPCAVGNLPPSGRLIPSASVHARGDQRGAPLRSLPAAFPERLRGPGPSFRPSAIPASGGRVCAVLRGWERPLFSCLPQPQRGAYRGSRTLSAADLTTALSNCARVSPSVPSRVVFSGMP